VSVDNKPNARSRAAKRFKSGDESWFSADGVCDARCRVFLSGVLCWTDGTVKGEDGVVKSVSREGSRGISSL
jgi:hypothetical protein